jgi:hypothetical chaperone protein
MRACGMDFGTSNSAMALPDPQGHITLAPCEGNHGTLPTALFYAASGGLPQVGRAAQKLFFEGEEGRFMRSLKRLLGTSLMTQATVVNGKPRYFDTIIADFMKHLKARAEVVAAAPLDAVVMGRPVHFVDGDNTADQHAEAQLAAVARQAGFAHVQFQFEPIAAAFAHERRVAREKLALVVDIGGGTSDFTLIKICADYSAKADRKDDILASHGIRTGGNDFDKQLSLAAFMPLLGYRGTYGDKNLAVPLAPFHDMSEWSKINFLYTPQQRREMALILREAHAPERLSRFARVLELESGHSLLAAVEETKIALTAQTAAAAPLGFIEPALTADVTREDFDRAIGGNMADILAAMDDCLQSAQTDAAKIDIVILTGGPTETPLLQDAIRKRFPQAAISEDERMASVALGLGHDAHRVFK